MPTPHRDTTVVLVLELDAARLRDLRAYLEDHPPLARYRVADPEGIEEVLGITTGWTRNTT